MQGSARGQVGYTVRCLKTEIAVLMLPLPPAESASPTVKRNVPVAVGVPETVPPALIASPGGREPELTDQVYGATPPAAAAAEGA